jgi:hypothetical protein
MMSHPPATSLSARVAFGVTVDLAPMLRAAVRASKRQHLGSDEVTEEEMQRACAVFAARAHEEQGAPDVELVERIRKGLPVGVTLVAVLDERNGSLSTSGLVLEVSDLTLLPSIVIDNGAVAAGQEPARPFAGFSVTATDDRVTVKGSLADPGVGMSDDGGNNNLFSTVKQWVRMELSRPPTHHNARRIDGRALVWELVLDANLNAPDGQHGVAVEVTCALPS